MQMAKDMGYDFTSMYIGGGTTTILEDELIKTIELARTLFPSMKEVSCETKDWLTECLSGYRVLMTISSK